MDLDSHTRLVKLTHSIKTSETSISDDSFRLNTMNHINSLPSSSLHDILSNPFYATKVIADSPGLSNQSNNIDNNNESIYDEFEASYRCQSDQTNSSSSQNMPFLVKNMEHYNLQANTESIKDFELLVAKCDGNEAFALSLLTSAGNDIGAVLQSLQE